MERIGWKFGNWFTVIADIIPAKAIVEPIDKSIPLITITIIIPTAKIERIAVLIKRVLILALAQNLCEVI